MSIALVHDYLTQLGGAEKVLTSLAELYPQSPIFVLLHDQRKTAGLFDNHRVRQTWLKYLPLAQNHYQWYLPLMPQAVQSHNLNGYDLIISSASSFAKNVRLPADSLHICYCHTPTRYLWHDSHSYVDELPYPQLIKKSIPLFLPRLRHLDFLAAQNVDYFIANSLVVQERIKKYYHRPSTIIYPPVNTAFFELTPSPGDYFLTGGRLVAYKKYDLAIKAFNQLGLKLKIFGNGPESARLRRNAYKNIEFLGPISDLVKKELYQKCLAFINPQVEDFGITAVEAMAAGRPVIAFAGGGALETIIPGQTGEFFEEQTWEALAFRLLRFQPEKYQPALIKEHAERFSAERFAQEMKNYIDNLTPNSPTQKIFSIKI